MTQPSVTLIVPTYREAANLVELLERIDAVRRKAQLDLEVLIMDDDSRDGTSELIASMQEKFPWVELVVRRADRGLSAAVIDGMTRAKNPMLVVMDADLSHPPEKVPDLVHALQEGSRFVIGSRYLPGASTDETWGIYRRLNSLIATWLALPFVSCSDPMSGFFALRKEDFLAADKLNVIGYKIGLELIVKCGIKSIAEVPIDFCDRKRGESKLNLNEQLRYLRHIQRLFRYKFGQFAFSSRSNSGS